MLHYSENLDDHRVILRILTIFEPEETKFAALLTLLSSYTISAEQTW